MYKLLIVEDEDLIRNAILSGIDWKALGLMVEGAEDGEIALETVRRFRPDIVLTDIRMPFIDGLELTHILKEKYPDIVVLILSGHDEFSYAQEALHLGVKKYIQKPIIPSDLIHIIQGLTQTLDEQRSRRNREAKLRMQLEESMPILRERLLNSIIHNTIKPDDIPSMMDFTGLKLRGQAYTICLVEPELSDSLTGEAAAVQSLSISEITAHELETDGVSFISPTGRRVIIYAARTQETERPYILSLLADIADAVYAEHGAVTTCSIGTRVRTIPELHVSYESAKAALEQRIFGGRGKIYDAYDMEAPQDYYPFAQLQSLLDQFRALPWPEFERALSDFFADLRQMRAVSSVNLLALMLDIVNAGYRQLLAAGGSNDACLHSIYERLFSLDTLDQYEDAVASFFSALRESLNAQHRSRGSQLISKICRHIDENFCDPALSLNSVSSAVYISPTYLSILFKKEMGTTFVDYVSRLRMEKAKELLRDGNLKTYEAAERTGYNDPQYFSSCFKKYTGLTPSEYKAQMKGGRL